MSFLTLRRTGEYLFFDESEARAAGKSVAERYQTAKPFAHIVIDDFLDSGLLRAIAASYPEVVGKQFFDRDQERLKFQYPPSEITNGLTRNLLAELNGAAFIGFLEEMTGIGGLIPDPYFAGGGLHQTKRGGHLSIHADFNVHAKMNVERRLNILIYLNDEWDSAYGGDLELWDQQMQQCEAKIAPLLGRAVIFNTNLESFHGHPDPLNCPPERDRRSIAAYYYTASLQPEMPKRSTTFQVRPGTGDKVDRRVRLNHFIKDWVPPRLQGLATRLNPFR